MYKKKLKVNEEKNVPSKIKRFDLSEDNENNPSQINRLNIPTEAACSHSKCTELIDVLKKELSDVKEQSKKQNEAVMEVLASQTVLIKTLIRQQKAVVSFSSSFPIKTEDDLAALENDINEENKIIYLEGMKSLMKGKPKKMLLAILSAEVIINFNLDGTHGKKRLKAFDNFYPLLKDAFCIGNEDPEEILRKAIQAVKKQHFYEECMKKKLH